MKYGDRGTTNNNNNNNIIQNHSKRTNIVVDKQDIYKLAECVLDAKLQCNVCVCIHEVLLSMQYQFRKCQLAFIRHFVFC